MTPEAFEACPFTYTYVAGTALARHAPQEHSWRCRTLNRSAAPSETIPKFLLDELVKSRWRQRLLAGTASCEVEPQPPRARRLMALIVAPLVVQGLEAQAPEGVERGYSPAPKAH